MLKVFLVCSGLGNVKRGFESFTQQCFKALLQETSLDITLFKGGGNSEYKAIKLWNFPRDAWVTIQLGKFTKRGAYFIEQVSFFCSMIPYIQLQKPDIIYYSDGTIGNLLWHWRQRTKQRYKLLFCNGGPLSPPFERCEHIQQVAPFHLKVALEAGVSAEKQSLVPYGIDISANLESLQPLQRKALRSRLRLPEERAILLSVAAINKSHKRIDYIIHEVASLPEPRPYLLLLGQQDSESPEIISKANHILGAANFQVQTVLSQEVATYFKIADAFVLASIHEGFGLVFLEAMSQGLPCLAHNYEITQYILGDHNYLADFELSGSLANLIPQVLAESHDEVKRRLRHQAIYSRFSWEQLRPNYIEMIQKCAANTSTTPEKNREFKIKVQKNY